MLQVLQVLCPGLAPAKVRQSPAASSPASHLQCLFRKERDSGPGRVLAWLAGSTMGLERAGVGQDKVLLLLFFFFKCLSSCLYYFSSNICNNAQRPNILYTNSLWGRPDYLSSACVQGHWFDQLWIKMIFETCICTGFVDFLLFLLKPCSAAPMYIAFRF